MSRWRPSTSKRAAGRLLEESLPADHWLVAAAANTRGAALAGMGRYDEAEELLLASNEILSDAPMPGIAEQSRRRLAALYETWGKEDRANSYR